MLVLVMFVVDVNIGGLLLMLVLVMFVVDVSIGDVCC